MASDNHDHSHDHSHNHDHDHDHSHDHHHHGHSHMHFEDIRKKGAIAVIVLIIALLTAIAEIYFGGKTGSRALTNDGWHMLSHTWVLGLTGLAYGFIWLNQKYQLLNISSKRALSIAGLLSAFTLLLVAIAIGYKSILDLMSPASEMLYGEALIVAFIGLIVNGFSAYILHVGHHDHDHNLRAAYLHLMADALTSLTAILALLAGRYLGWDFLDPIVGILAAIIIAKWAYELILVSGKDAIKGEKAHKH